MDEGLQFEMDLDPEPPSLPPPLTRSGRPGRRYQLPKRFRDILPEPPAPVDIPVPAPHVVRRVILIVRDRLVTTMNSFGLWRDYPNRPTTDPDATLTLDDLSNSRNRNRNSQSSNDTIPQPPDSPRSSYWPFSSPTVHGIMKWLNNGNTLKSEIETNHLVHNVILSPSFNREDLVGFDAHRENQRLDKALKESTLRNQFTESSVDILVPSGDINIQPKHFTVPGLLHRKLTSVIQEAFESPLAHHYHFSPFKLFQKSPSTGETERVYGEIYTSDAFLAEVEEVRLHAPLPPDNADCRREKVVAALMFSSDATVLTDFGTTKAWPVYAMFGNLSKYLRGQTDSGAMHHLAYIPSVSLF